MHTIYDTYVSYVRTRYFQLRRITSDNATASSRDRTPLSSFVKLPSIREIVVRTALSERRKDARRRLRLDDLRWRVSREKLMLRFRLFGFGFGFGREQSKKNKYYSGLEFYYSEQWRTRTTTPPSYLSPRSTYQPRLDSSSKDNKTTNRQ
jgi:hypothetical protein